jgi:outer membrane lipoprotein-sorting protein
MTAGRRWWVVGVGVLLLVAAPVLVRALPASDSDVSAHTLWQRIQSSRDVSFSGYAETVGHVALPSSGALSGLSRLLGDTSRVRVWWRDPTVWRTATLRPTGETDLVHAGDRTVRWVYESKNATVYPDVPVRLPTTADMLPPELARRVLSGARPSELSRIPARRVAGHDALGLRLRPEDPQAAIGRVDVYADRASGSPLQAEVFARGGRTAVLTSRFLDFAVGRPSPSTMVFHPPEDARVRFDSVVDLAAAADQFAARVPPASLAGLPPRREARPGSDPCCLNFTRGSVGVYGRGPTVLLAIPLWRRTADPVRHDLAGRPGVQTLDEGLLLGADPLHVLLANPEHNDNSWLLAGTVTRQALLDAADQLSAHPPALRLP